MKSTLLGALAIAAAASAPASAAQVLSTSYAMPNGNTGSYHYWDVDYTGSGCTTCDGAALSGGSGDLTDGVTATQSWGAVENIAGTGPYVGWFYFVTNNPVINFNFSGSPTINQISLHVDNTTGGGVYAPAAILVDGVAQSFTAPALGTIGTINLTGLNLTGGSHSVELQQQYNTWTFVSEVSFFGPAGVPEPAAWAMLLGGFGLLGAASRRRKSATVFA